MTNEHLPQGEPLDTVTICWGGTCSCPTVDIYPEGLILKDDFGGSVLLTREQWNLAKEMVKV